MGNPKQSFASISRNLEVASTLFPTFPESWKSSEHCSEHFRKPWKSPAHCSQHFQKAGNRQHIVPSISENLGSRQNIVLSISENLGNRQHIVPNISRKLEVVRTLFSAFPESWKSPAHCSEHLLKPWKSSEHCSQHFRKPWKSSEHCSEHFQKAGNPNESFASISRNLEVNNIYDNSRSILGNSRKNKKISVIVNQVFYKMQTPVNLPRILSFMN
ncbi:MAG: hypothetical protein KBT20_01110 [Bacteroidales bacterium]|nr:hypothetical protein [Candidatus Liminaster caballi]